MPRPPRIRIAGIPLHVIQRGNDRNQTFFCIDDYQAYIDLLVSACRRYDTQVHAYVLMTNHVHLLMTSKMDDGVSRTMQYVGSNYTRRINNRQQRTGTLWEGRFRSSAVDSDSYCLACYRYIELNPVRAGMVALPQDYRWSSFCENVGERTPCIVEPHISFLALASSLAERVKHYRAIAKEGLPDITLDAIRRASRQGKPFGSDEFKARLERKHERETPESGSDPKGSDPKGSDPKGSDPEGSDPFQTSRRSAMEM